jgi:hypothetical protein
MSIPTDRLRRLFPLFTLFILAAALVAFADGQETPGRSPEITALVRRAADAAGGEAVLPRYVMFKDRVLIGDTDTGFGTKRESYVDAPAHWWLKTPARVTERVDEPARYLVWAWTLRALTDGKSVLEAIPDVTDGGAELWGLRVSGTVEPAMDLYFAKTNNLLARIDWRRDIHRFSDWRTAASGFKYPARIVGHRKDTGKIWYFDDVLELKPLESLPVEIRNAEPAATPKKKQKNPGQ